MPVTSIGIIAASSATPMVELEMGVERLRGAGFTVEVHPAVREQHFTFAGTDEQRAGALWEYASDERFSILWCACGGYGATRLLPLLDRLTMQHGPPPRKLLVGYSDVTALHQFVHRRWDWATLHAPMPSAFDPDRVADSTWQSILAFVRGERPLSPWGHGPLAFIGAPPASPIEAELIGGNLSIWAAMAGTPNGPGAGANRLLFLEEVGEEFYRIDRMMTQVEQAGMLNGVRGIVLGEFTRCVDQVRSVRSADDPAAMAPLRRAYTLDEALAETFGSISRRLGIPVARGLPVGHGPEFAPLPLGAKYRLTPQGGFDLLDWV